MKDDLVLLKIIIAANAFCAVLLGIIAILFFRAHDVRAWYVLVIAVLAMASAAIGGSYAHQEKGN